MKVSVIIDGTKGKSNITFPNSKKIVVGSSCIEKKWEKSDCSPYKAVFEKGEYLIECFGASGTTVNDGLSLGGYTSGIIKLATQTTLYLYIGEQGKINGSETFNGGGKGHNYSSSGGGATDVRQNNGEYNDKEGLRSRIMVAAGGGGQSKYSVGSYYNERLTGNGGGLNGEMGNIQYLIDKSPTIVITNAEGGTQSKGGMGGYNPENEDIKDDYINVPEQNGTFGIGGSAHYGSGGGGGGYFGGGAGKTNSYQVGSGGGGSSYISGHPGCMSVLKGSTNFTTIDYPYHYSGLFFTNTRMSNGSSEEGSFGPGYIRITIINTCNTCNRSQFYYKMSLFIFILIIQSSKS